MLCPVIAIVASAITLIAAMPPKRRALPNMQRHEIRKRRTEPTHAVKALHLEFVKPPPDAQVWAGHVLTGVIN